jgi:hypothetical protein
MPIYRFEPVWCVEIVTGGPETGFRIRESARGGWLVLKMNGLRLFSFFEEIMLTVWGGGIYVDAVPENNQRPAPMKNESQIAKLQSRISRLGKLPQSKNIRRRMAYAYRMAGALRYAGLHSNQ